MTIRFFSAAGASLGSFGRDGEGPGEFRSMGWAGWNGDTLYVEDSGIRRVTFIGPDQKLLRTVPEPVRISPPKTLPTSAPLLGSAAIVAVVADGSYLLDFFPSGSQPTWLPLPSGAIAQSLLHIDRDGRYIAVTANLVHHEPWCGWGHPAIGVPFCSHWLLSDHFGHGIASITVANGPQDGRYHLLMIGSVRGDTQINRNYDYHPVAIPRRVVDSARRELMSQPRLSSEQKAAYQSVPFPRYYPPVVRILVGMDRSVWLEEYTTVPGVHAWRILDAKGIVSGVLTVPASVVLMDVRINAAWGTRLNSDGLQDVVRFEVY
jgi:hypothetical protein